jgi:predicted dienelactone hydrolase
VGFEEITIPYLDEPALKGGAWYPADGDRLPLVVISHGGGGSYDGHQDTASALARAGFVVAAVSHAGDTYDDQGRVLELWRRPDQLQRLVTFMLTAWRGHDRINVNRVGAFGFSNGGFTVLVAAGGVPDLDRTAHYCGAHPDHDLCAALSKAQVSPHLGSRTAAGTWTHDRRIRAIVVAAPAFGFAFDKDRLRGVTIPVQLWGGALDRHQPAPWYEDAVAAALPLAPAFHRVPGAGHFDFLPPCTPTVSKAAPAICASEPGFDRAAFHRELNARVVDFFSRQFGRRGKGALSK